MSVASRFLQIVLTILAFYCAISRLIDHRHHPEDVIFGSTIGALLGIYGVYEIQKFK